MTRRALTAAAALTAALALAGCGSSAHAAAPTSPAGHTLTVQFQLNVGPDGQVYCDTGARGGYSDIGPSTSVTVHDGAGKVIGAAPLGNHCTRGPGGSPGVTPQWIANWTTTIPNVPDVPFYQVEIGHRGKLTYSRSDLAAKEWAVTTSLGDGS